MAQHIHDKDSVEVFFEPRTIRYRTEYGEQEARAFKQERAPRAAIVELE